MKTNKHTQKPTKEKRSIGRPRILPREKIMTRLCEIIAQSNKGLRTAVKEINQEFKLKIDVGMIFDWLDDSPELAQRYVRAKEEQADYLVDEMLQIADDTSDDEIFVEVDDASGKSAKKVINHEAISRSRLRVDTRKWIASKLKPKRYGEKLDVGSSEPVEVRIKVIYEDKPE